MSVRRTSVRMMMKDAVVRVIGLAGCLLLGAGPAWAINLDLNDARAVYGEAATKNTVSYRDLDASVASLPWTTPVQLAAPSPTGSATSAEIQWVVSKISPRTGQHLLGVQYVAPCPTGGWCAYLNLLSHPDAAPNDPPGVPAGDDTLTTTPWTVVAGFPINLGPGTTFNYHRHFDIAVGSKTGRFLVVYRSPSDPRRLAYLELGLNGLVISPGDITPWSLNSSLGGDGLSVNDGAINWVKLVPHPHTDEALLLYTHYMVDATNTIDSFAGGLLKSFRWNGAAQTWTQLTVSPRDLAFPDPKLLTWANNQSSQAFDAAYEQTSGRVLLVYDGVDAGGYPSSTRSALYRNLAPNATQWSNTTNFMPSVDFQSAAIAAAAESGSNQIAVGIYGVNKGYLIMGLWDGSACLTGSIPLNCFGASVLNSSVSLRTLPAATPLDGNAYATGRIPLAAGWVGTSPNGVAIVTYSLQSANTVLNWARWPDATSSWQWPGDPAPLVNAGLSTTDKYGWLIEPSADDTTLLVAFGDMNRRLEAARYNGSVWSTTTTPPPILTSNLPAHGAGPFYGRPFDVAINGFVIPTLAVTGSPAKVPVTLGTPQDLGLTLTITDTAGVIYADNPDDGDGVANRDIAIAIPSTLTGVVWDKGTVCLGGTGIAQVSHGASQGICATGQFQTSPPAYSADSKTLYLNALTDFNAGETLTISNLGVSFQAGASAGAAAPLTVSVNTAPDSDPTKDTDFDLLGAPSIQPVESLTLSAPVTQVPNAFTTTGSIPPTALLRVALTATGGNVALTAFGFSQSLAPPSALTLASLQVQDESTGAVYPASPQAGLAFSGIPDKCATTKDFCIANGTTKTLVLLGSASGLAATTPAESATLSLSPGGITAAKGETSTVTPLPASALTGVTVSTTHTVSTYTIAHPKAGDTVVVGTQGKITWTSYGQASVSNVAASYSTDGTTWTALNCTVTSSGSTGSCKMTVPDVISSTAQVKIKDASQPIEQTSAIFTLAGVTQLSDLGALSLPGGPTWIVGKAHTVTWKQLGSFTTRLELSPDNGQTWPTILGTQAVTAPTETSVAFSYTPTLADQAATAKVRARPDLADPTIGNRTSATLAIQPAFSGIQPSGGQVLANQPVTITWNQLAGTKPGDSAFPIPTVTITVRDASGNPVQSMNTGNSGSAEWTPSQAATGLTVTICNANAPTTVCGAGTAAFDVISPSVTLNPAQTDYKMGDAIQINWAGGLTGNIKLLLVDQGGNPVLDITPPMSSNGSGTYNWTIPASLSVPQQNARVRLQSVDRPSVFTDSSAFTIHGILQNVGVSPSPVKTENAAADASNDVTISWQATGATPVKLWIKRQGDTDYQPLSSFGAGAAADAVSGTSFIWTNVLGTTKTPQAKIKVTQVGDEGSVFAESGTFAIVGEVAATKPATGASVDLNNPAQLPVRLEWATIRGPMAQVRLRVLDNANAPQPLNDSGATELLVPNPASPSGYDWTPPTTYPSLHVEVCDADNLSVCAVSGAFSVTGLKVVSPTAGSRFVIGQTGITIPITWKPVGGKGAVNLLYRIGTGQPVSLAAGVASLDNTLNTYTWVLPATFADLSDQVVVMVQDTSGAPTNESAPVTIAGQLTLTGVVPTKATYAVGEAINLAWQRFGGIQDVQLQYCGVNCATAANWHNGPVLTNVSTPTGTFSNWAIPLDAISAALQLRAVDATASHPAADSTPVTITVTPGLTLTLPDASPWVADEVHPIQWSTNGLVDQVQLLYSLNGGPFVPMAGTPLPNGVVQNTTGDVQWQGSFNWQTVDPNLPRDPLSYSPATVVLKVVDVSNGHVPVEQVSSSLSLIYLKVIWQVMDLTTRSILGGLNVLETSFSSGTATWQVTDNSIIPNSPRPVGVLRYYPADQYTTTWSQHGSSQPAVVSGWQVDRSKLQDLNGDGVVDPLKDGIVKTAFLELDANQQLPWGVPLRFQYLPGPPASVLIMGWLEKRGILQDAQLVQRLDVEIRDGTQAIKTLSNTSPDSTGVFRVTWDLTDNAGNPANPDLAYYAKATITMTTGAALTSGDMLAMTIPKTLEQVKTDTAQTQATVAALPTQLSAAQTAIQSDIAVAKADLGMQVAGVKDDTTSIKQDTVAIKAETDTISTKVLPAINNVQAYLQDPNAGLPKIQQTLTQQGDQLKVLRRGGILNMETQLDPGASTILQYRSGGGAPALTVYNSAGVPIPTAPLGLNPTTGLYESTLSLAAEGVYRAVVTEPASANSAGTIDSVTLTVHAPAATAQALGAITTQLDTLSTQITTTESNLTSLMATAAAIDANTSATKTIADQLALDAKTLLGKWGTLDAPSLMTALTNLSTQMGTPAQEASVQSALSALSTLHTDLASLSAQVGTPAQDASVQAALSQLATLQTNLTTLGVQVGAPAQAAALQTALTQLGAVQTGLAGLSTQVGTPAQSADVQKTLTQLGTLQTAVTNLQTALGTPAQAAALTAVQTGLTNAQASLATLAGTKNVTMDTVSDRFDSLAKSIANLPQTQGADQTQRLTDMAAQITKLEQDLTTLGTPAQKGNVDDLLTKVTSVQDTVSSLSKQGTDTGSLLAKLQDLQKAVESAQGSSAAVGLSQGAFAAASEAVTLLQQLQTEIRANATKSALAPALLGQFGDKMQEVANTVTVIPGKLDMTEFNKQLTNFTERLKSVATEKGYHFDTLYQMTEAQGGDVKTVRNRVEELKALVEVQKAILEQRVNEPIVKTWFEASH